ncbi:hypothetical protein NL676_033218 [Syzygium grande]|nr:hypothetical protein NL676_033218 [Syzygium grande]
MSSHTAAMSKMMSDLMAKQQQINVASQSEIPPPTRQGLRLDKSPTVNTNPTLQLDDAIVIDTSASPSVPVPHSPPNDENTKLLAKLDQRLREVEGTQSLIAMGEEIETGLKKGWYSESGSSSKRFTGKKDKEHAPEVNMTYVQKTPAQAPKLQFTTQQATSYGRGSREQSNDCYRSRTGAGQSPLPPSINDTFHSAGVVGGYEHLNLSSTEDDLGLIFPESLQALTDPPKKHGKAILVNLSDDSEDDQSPCIFKKPESKVVDFDDDIPYLTGWFAETSIGAITEGPLEGMGAGPQV